MEQNASSSNEEAGASGEPNTPATRTAQAVVVVCIPEFELVRLEMTDGRTLSIGDAVQGVDWWDLRVGQSVLCEYVGEHATRVLRAEVLSSPTPDVPADDGTRDSSVTRFRLFLDTEFSGPPEERVLLSIGLVADGGVAFYKELTSEDVAALPATLVDSFLRDEVLSQFGRVPDTNATHAEMPDALVAWLNEFEADELEIVYDYSADYAFIEQLVKSAGIALQPQLLPCHVGYLLEEPSGVAAAERAWNLLQPAMGFGRHHALADAFALMWRFEAVHGTS